MNPRLKSVETKHMEERRELFRGLGQLDRRSFLRVAGAAMGAAAASGLTPYHSFQPVSVAADAAPAAEPSELLERSRRRP